MNADASLRKMLVVKLADLGDVLLCEPALRSLRTTFPGARIDLLVPESSAPVAELIGQATCVLTLPTSVVRSVGALHHPRTLRRLIRFTRELRSHRYDTVVLFHHLTTSQGALKYRVLVTTTGARVAAGLDNGRGTFLTHRAIDRGFGAFHEAEYMLQVAQTIGGAEVDPRPRVLADIAGPCHPLPTRFAAIFPATGSYSMARTWPADRFATVASSLQEAGVATVIVGGSDARSAAEIIRQSCPGAIDLTGRTSLMELARVIAKAEVVVGGDSFIGHLAAALDRPVVSIFGPSNADAWRPYVAQEDGPARSLVVRHPLPCEPCLYTGYSLGRRDGCPARTCLHLVTPADVLRAVEHVMEAA
jgi:ADP-heptose:LPS heptosyltransferase